MFCKTYNLSRLYVSYKFSSDGSNRTALRSQEISIISFSNTKRLQSKRISGTDHLSRRTDNQCIRSLYLLHRIFYRIFCLLYIQTFSGDMICDHLRVNRCLENSACVLQFMAKFNGICQIAVMCNCKDPFHIIDNQRHRILSSGSTCCRISYMSDTKISLQFL